MTLLVALDYASVAVFALTGALVASRAQLDIVGFIFIACLTAVGGGTLRDVLINRDPESQEARLDAGLDESMDASDPTAASQPGQKDEPVPSSSFPE